MNSERLKYVGREFLKRYGAASENRLVFDANLNEFRNSELAMRREVGHGLLSIATDYSENPHQRAFSLCVLATMVQICGLVGDEDVESQLEKLVNHPVPENPHPGQCLNEGNAGQIRYRALLAMMGVHREAGLNKLDQLLGLDSKSQFAQRLRELRDRCANNNGDAGDT